MVKPVGAICNLDCTYCSYPRKEALLGSASKFRMSDEVLETHIRNYLCSGAQKFWTHVDPCVKEIIARVKQEQPAISA
jgi:sulfatase maturation enzyme AslB (radical SAM superfamily)